MNKSNNNQQRAADFLRQWQEQMTRQMSNPDAIRAMLDAMQQFGNKSHDANARRPAHAPDARHDAIGDIAERLHAVEQQLRRLHARLDAAEKSARAGQRGNPKPVAANQRRVAKPAKRKPAAKSQSIRKKR